MKVRAYGNRLRELNAALVLFPNQANDDYAGANVKLDDDELLEIIEHSLPNSWMKQAVLMDFQPENHTYMEVIEFFERLEELGVGAESDQTNNNGKRKKVDKSSDKKRPRVDSSDRQSYDCEYHGKNHTHDTRDCKVIKALREERDKKRSAKKHLHGKGKPSQGGQYFTEEELNTLVSKNLNKLLKKASNNKKTKKGKAEANAIDETNPDDSDIDFGNFDFNNLELDSSDDQSTSSSDSE